ncbi:hypothetical protein DIPPA_21736 [Diplonema papillatum]|nr:hypothetical protein DIPPA_27161 [Diplonema papillatum]KAJ9460923.1 hypothetical protein DIPPA_21736 [Diplonema papillatum]
METDAVPDSNSNNNNNNNDNHYKDCNDDSNKDDGADNYASDSSTRRKRKLSDDDEPSASRLEEDEFLESIQFNEIIEELRARALERRPRRGQLRGFIAERCILKDEDEQRMKSQLGRLYSGMHLPERVA